MSGPKDYYVTRSEMRLMREIANRAAQAARRAEDSRRRAEENARRLAQEAARRTAQRLELNRFSQRRTRRTKEIAAAQSKIASQSHRDGSDS